MYYPSITYYLLETGGEYLIDIYGDKMNTFIKLLSSYVISFNSYFVATNRHYKLNTCGAKMYFIE